MIEPNSLKNRRNVAIADHLWAAFEQMAQEMGSDRDGLINQALFMFARLNGFLVPGSNAVASNGPALAAVKSARAAPAPPPEPAEDGGGDQAVGNVDDYLQPPPPPPQPTPSSRGGNRVPPAPPSNAKSSRPGSDGPPLVDRGSGDYANEGGGEKQLDDDPVRRKVAQQVLDTAAQLEKLIKSKNEPARPALVNSDSTNSGAEAGGEKLLYLTGDDGEMLKVAKDRFLIGRGKHCDLVINSGKVSREHAAVVREGADFFIEDLGSSNGTWFNKQRIKRRKVEEGDEYFICSEKVRCTYR